MKFMKDEILRIQHHAAIGFEAMRAPVTGASTDSRNVKQGDVFLAIRGEKFDGHNFVTTAVQSGVSAVVVDRRWAEANPAMMVSLNVPKLIVENTVLALGELARLHRRKWKIPVLAVAGSNGKTTTKEMIKQVLAEKFKVLATEGNLNNHIGVPLTILRLDKAHAIAVVEVGTNHFGEIKYLAEVLEPTHGLITNIGHEHLEFFGTVQGVAKAEGELFDWLRENKGTALVNRDDSHLSRISKGMKSVGYGMAAKSVDVKGALAGFDERACPRVTIKPKAKKSLVVDLKVPGEHNAYNALAAAAVGIYFKIPGTKIQKALSSFGASSKRMEMFSLAGVTILNDTYNSNPDSVVAALSTLRSMNTSGKRIVVLADMLELGKEAMDQHRHIGLMVSRHNIEYLLTYGPLSKFTNDAAQTKFKIHYDQKNMLCEYLAELLSEGDVVLVKGSRGMKMEDVVEFLKARLQADPKIGGGEKAA